MDTYRITIRTLTDTMLGSGESVPGIIDNDIKYDRYGIPYMNAKTLKGHLREQMEMLKAVGGAEYAGVSIEDLLGSSDRESEKKLGKLHFSRVRPSENVCRTIEKAVQEGTTRPEEILDALTVMNTYTRIGDNGIVEHGSLRTARMFRKDLVLTADLLTEPLTEEEHTLLKDAVMALQHIGTMKSKGKGLVACTLKRTGGEDHA